MKYKINLSLKALIYGLKCKGRGYESRVTEHERYNEDNYFNAMKRSWKDRKEFSTWCKFRFSTQFNNSNKFIEQTTNYFDGNPDNSYYGQFNFFMKLSIPSEKILHGLKIASVTAVSNHTPSYMWNHPNKNKNEQYKSRSVIDCIDFRVSKLNMLQSGVSFVPFTDVFATKFGVIGVDKDGNPYVNEKNNLPKEKNLKRSNFTTDRIDNISKLYFIELQPERHEVKFDVNNNEMYNS